MTDFERFADGIYYFWVRDRYIAVSALEARYARFVDAMLVDDADEQARARVCAEAIHRAIVFAERQALPAPEAT